MGQGTMVLLAPCEGAKSCFLLSISATRYRDLYDMHYIGHRKDLGRARLTACAPATIIDDPGMRDDDMAGIASRGERALSNKRFLARTKSSHREWIGKKAVEVARRLPGFLRDL